VNSRRDRREAVFLFFADDWDPYWSSSLFGSYSAVRFSGAPGDLTTAKGQYCALFALTHPGQGRSYTCDPNFNASQLGLITRWTQGPGVLG